MGDANEAGDMANGDWAGRGDAEAIAGIIGDRPTRIGHRSIGVGELGISGVEFGVKSTFSTAATPILDETATLTCANTPVTSLSESLLSSPTIASAGISPRTI